MRDDDLIARAKTGDQEAWRDLYLRHATRLSALLRLLPTGDGAIDSEDVAAQAWLTAASSIASFKGDADAFGGWLYTIARNHCSRTRTRAAHTATPIVVGGAAELDQTAVMPAPSDQSFEQLDYVHRLLALLPAKQRDVVAFLEVVGLDIRTTATTLGMSQPAVRVARHRGLARLRAAMAAER